MGGRMALRGLPFEYGGSGESMEAVLFYVLGAITLISACCVVLLRRPIHNVLFMIMTMLGLAGLFVLLRAEFVAMVQVIVYAGAVMVLFLFVIMLLNLDQVRLPVEALPARLWIGILMALGLLALVGSVIVAVAPKVAPAVTPDRYAGLSNTEIVANELFTTYLLPFEITSVLLLSAMIGAVILARKRSRTPQG